MSSDRTSCRLSDCPASRRPGDCPAETDTPSDIRRLGGEARHWQGNPTIKGIKGQEAPTRIQAHSETKLTQDSHQGHWIPCAYPPVHALYASSRLSTSGLEECTAVYVHWGSETRVKKINLQAKGWLRECSWIGRNF